MLIKIKILKAQGASLMTSETNQLLEMGTGHIMMHVGLI